MNSDSNKNLSDTFKVLFEFFKHLTTLSSGSILVILAIAEKFLRQPADITFLMRSLFLFCVAILTALIAMGILAFHASGDMPSEGSRKFLAWGMGMAGIGFFGGMALLIMTVLRAFG